VLPEWHTTVNHDHLAGLYTYLGHAIPHQRASDSQADESPYASARSTLNIIWVPGRRNARITCAGQIYCRREKPRRRVGHPVKVCGAFASKGPLAAFLFSQRFSFGDCGDMWPWYRKTVSPTRSNFYRKSFPRKGFPPTAQMWFSMVLVHRCSTWRPWRVATAIPPRTYTLIKLSIVVFNIFN